MAKTSRCARIFSETLCSGVWWEGSNAVSTTPCMIVFLFRFLQFSLTCFIAINCHTVSCCGAVFCLKLFLLALESFLTINFYTVALRASLSHDVMCTSHTHIQSHTFSTLVLLSFASSCVASCGWRILIVNFHSHFSSHYFSIMAF